MGLLWKYITDFGKCLIALDIESQPIPVFSQFIRCRVEVNLSARTVVTKELNAKLKHKTISIFILPSADTRKEVANRNVTETIFTEIHVFVIHEVVMQKQAARPPLIKPVR